MLASTISLTSAAVRIRTRAGGLGAGGAPTSATFPGARKNSWATSTGYSPRHRRNLIGERFTPELLPWVTPAVTGKLRHPGTLDAAGHAVGKPRRTAKRLSATRPGRCFMADDPTAGAGELGADTAADYEPDYP